MTTSSAWRFAPTSARSPFGVAFTGCTLPGATEPLFAVPPQRMGVGLGIHGEPGIGEEAVLPASDLAALLVNKLVAEKPADSNGVWRWS